MSGIWRVGEVERFQNPKRETEKRRVSAKAMKLLFFDFCSAGENYTPTYGLPTPSQLEHQLERGGFILFSRLVICYFRK